MHRLSEHNKVEILEHIENINKIHPANGYQVLFKFPSMPILELFGRSSVPYNLFGTVDGISSQIDRFTGPVGLVYCFVDYVPETKAYVVKAFPVEILEWSGDETR